MLGLLAAGEARETILRASPCIEPDGIDESLRYAARLAGDKAAQLAR